MINLNLPSMLFRPSDPSGDRWQMRPQHYTYSLNNQHTTAGFSSLLWTQQPNGCCSISRYYHWMEICIYTYFRICGIAFLTFSTFPSSPARTHTFPLFCELSLPEGCCIYMLHARWVGWMISWHSLALRVVFWLTQCEPWGSEQCECKNNRIGFVYSVID